MGATVGRSSTVKGLGYQQWGEHQVGKRLGKVSAADGLGMDGQWGIEAGGWHEGLVPSLRIQMMGPG